MISESGGLCRARVMGVSYIEGDRSRPSKVTEMAVVILVLEVA